MPIRIACVDVSAAARLKLQTFLDNLANEHRGAVGHCQLSVNTPLSLEQLFVSTPPDAVAIGPEFSLEESYLTCRKVRETFQTVPIIVILSANAYSLRSLRRFHDVADEIFRNDEPPVRLVHHLVSLERRASLKTPGLCIFCEGVKGGVGTSSLLAAYAHAAATLGKRSVVVDLSVSAALIQYLLPQRWQSPEYGAMLVDGLLPDRQLIERCLTTAPNGVSLLLPPAGGSDVRELWIRNPDKFELTLAVIDILREIFDLVLIDAGGAEGILPFALMVRSTATVLITSNEPAAVHLLNSKLGSISDALVSSRIFVVINQLVERGLSSNDISQFLELHDRFTANLRLLGPVPFDTRGRNWIGSGNTFYTEASRSTQRQLEYQLEAIADLNVADASPEQGARWEFPRLIFRRFHRQQQPKPAKQFGLPDPTVDSNPSAPGNDWVSGHEAPAEEVELFTSPRVLSESEGENYHGSSSCNGFSG